MSDSKRVTYVCSRCGSTNVISDALTRWDVRQQAWIVEGHYDSSECLDCEQEAKLIEVELTPEPQD
jgi:DNA-directed RNA polymerase subunit RPC12/RpoP